MSNINTTHIPPKNPNTHHPLFDEDNSRLPEMPSVDGTLRVQGSPPVPIDSPLSSPTSTTTQATELSTTTSKPPSSATAAGDGGEAEEEEKLSNAEIKKRAKAEKQAKRAQKKVEQGVDITPQQQQQQSQQSKETIPRPPQSQRRKQNSQASVTKEASLPLPQSSSPTQAKALPHRTINHVADILPPPPAADDKRVGLFAHLYSNLERTTMANSAKDVHPAVLALGLQMKEYAICGSSARLVATLVAFKRVCSLYVSSLGACVSGELTGLKIGNRVIFNSSWNISPSKSYSSIITSDRVFDYLQTDIHLHRKRNPMVETTHQQRGY